ncbi:MAG: dihydroorotate dehydrogenase [Candidatus Omnitrophica bacterium]|nr:dihydroorotate dehydrogenase [Candidatus Omnitrophota bacterium]MBU1048003.1 dihydroorotate dehydrogenase [Candidatus Omnitrophota bacterium]MBU1630195.1 dihydroorotate dehydrogenase [Candidatus Omnitrophota bacterium]MBU1766596.1 dihydroorotate dehydrogenase [Candidatus Omnitrophota bacterium]MBU1889373.1 dihydroorotate dehydrogenase [Candidatus Omnitrophota bacterium]
MKNKQNLSVKLGNIKLQNPVILASGTCGFGEEISEFLDLGKIGALITKTITLKPKEGNPPPRIAEIEGGIINSIGLENPGVEVFIKEKLPFLKKIKIPFFVSISGETDEEFVELARILDGQKQISAIELNLSCPNLKRGRNLFGQDPKITYNIIKKVKKITSIPIIAKLTPQVKNITEIALACQKADCDIISLINTIPAMVIDLATGKPFLGGITGGLSGPAIKPIALKMVYDVAKTVDIPIIGCGGITSGKDAIEFMLAGASAVSIGTASLVSPDSSIEIIKEIEDYLVRHKIDSLKELVGSIHK